MQSSNIGLLVLLCFAATAVQYSDAYYTYSYYYPNTNTYSYYPNTYYYNNNGYNNNGYYYPTTFYYYGKRNVDWNQAPQTAQDIHPTPQVPQQ